MGKTKEPVYIDSRVVQHKSRKQKIWIFWLILMVLSAVYVALSIVTFADVTDIYDNSGPDLAKKSLWGLLTALIIPPVCMILFFIGGTILLIRKTVAESGFSYSFGLFHASMIWLGFMTLMAAIVLHGYKDEMNDVWEKRPQDDWSSSKTSLAQATLAFAYITAILFLVLFFLLIALRAALRQLDLKGDDPHPEKVAGAAAGGAAAGGAAKGKKEDKHDLMEKGQHKSTEELPKTPEKAPEEKKPPHSSPLQDNTEQNAWGNNDQPVV